MIKYTGNVKYVFNIALLLFTTSNKGNKFDYSEWYRKDTHIKE